MEKKQILQVLLPAGAVGLIVVLVGAIAAISTPSGNPTTPAAPAAPAAAPGTPPTPEATPTTVRSDVAKMSDGTDPTADDPGLRDGGEGLQVRDLKEGTGDPVPAGAKVKVHYTGWLTNGTVFDSSVQRGEPIEFPLTGVVRGWTIGIPGMKPGGVRKLVIPAALGYGNRATGKIPPNSTLIFEVELLTFQNP